MQRHGIGRLPDVGGDKPPKKKSKAYPIGFFHIDIAEVHTAESKLRLFVAIDRTGIVTLLETAALSAHVCSCTGSGSELDARLLLSS